MSNILPKKQFHFNDFGVAALAIEAWWAHQDKHHRKRTLLHISAKGRETDVCVSDKHLADQPKIIKFLRQNYNGTFTVHDTPQVHTRLDDAFNSV